MKLRPYQLELACDVIASFECIARKIVAVLPTGGGKTPVVGFVAAQQDGNIWVIAHRDRLIRQLSGTLKRFNLPHGIVKSGYDFDPKQRIQVASIQTLTRRHHLLPPPTMVIVDETHHAVSKSYTSLLDTYPKALILGVTATPCRMNGQGLGEVFDHMILGPTPAWLTENGFLAQAKYFCPPQVADTSQIPSRAGDFAADKSAEVMNKSSVTGDAVQHYREICDGTPVIVFCTSIQHAKDVAQAYRDAGYRAVSVDGTMGDDACDDALNGLADGRWQIVTSCELIGEGVDVPICGAVQFLRPTKSLVLHLQMIGRALRPLDGKTAYVLDHVGNVRSLGTATTPRDWSLEGKAKTRKPAVAGLKTCSSCFLTHEPSMSCPNCGYEYPKKERTKIEQVDGKLVEFTETKEERAEALKKARSMIELIHFAKARGYAKPTFWARKVYFGRSYVGNMPRM